ncbi:hypothetical protein OPV22_023070 [Ensete ventricosum]|uniref:Uncharacterized protein n=1 Tax=Ensete ventricosum TaxID=4639 RepID=A0AAV8QPV0_ENSVE|nr:hypothetical protein OPV22_023070 [Ensete ventricosum]
MAVAVYGEEEASCFAKGVVGVEGLGAAIPAKAVDLVEVSSEHVERDGGISRIQESEEDGVLMPDSKESKQMRPHLFDEAALQAFSFFLQ